MDFENLNLCVDSILRKKKISKDKIKAIIKHNPNGRPKEKHRRIRKNSDQYQMLLDHYRQNPNWEKNIIEKLAQEVGLKESQIYKWNWDMRKKDGLITNT